MYIVKCDVGLKYFRGFVGRAGRWTESQRFAKRFSTRKGALSSIDPLYVGLPVNARAVRLVPKKQAPPGFCIRWSPDGDYLVKDGRVPRWSKDPNKALKLTWEAAIEILLACPGWAVEAGVRPHYGAVICTL